MYIHTHIYIFCSNNDARDESNEQAIRSKTHNAQGALTAASKEEQDAQLSQRDRAAGCVIVFAKTRRLEL